MVRRLFPLPGSFPHTNPKIRKPKIQATCSQFVASIRRAERAFAEAGEKGHAMQTTPILHIIPFLSGQAFQPETIEAMGIAYENVCKSLKLVDGSGLLNELIARNIVELATSGERDPERLCTSVLATYKPATG
jgi:hypothetical protein